MQVALGIVLHCEKSLLEMEDMEEMVDFLKSEVGPATPACSLGCCASHLPRSFALRSRAVHHHVFLPQACRLNGCSCRSPAGAVRCCRTLW